MWGSGDIIPLVPSLAIRYRPIVRITPLSFLTQVQCWNYPSFRRLCGSRSRSGFFWKQTNPLLLPVIEPRFLGCLAHSLVIIATTLSRRSSFAVVINLFGVKCFFYNQNYHASYHWRSLHKSPLWSELAVNVYHSWWLTKKNRNIRKARPENRIWVSFVGDERISNITE